MNEDFRKHAPEPLESIPFNVPKPFKTELSNGLKIVMVEDKRHPLVNFRLAFPTGDICDPKDGVGITSTMCVMLNEGTVNYTSKELAETVENLGASLGVSVGQDNIIVKANTLSKYQSEVIALIAEITLRPTFPADELALHKKNAIEGLKYQRSQPDFLSDEQVGKILYGSHPYGVNSPNESDINNLKRDQLVDQHSKLFIANNATLIVVGDIDKDALVKEIEENLGSWNQGEVQETEASAFPARVSRSLTIVDRPGSSQSNIVIANLAIDRKSPDYFPVMVMNQILGAGASSRLFMNLREEKGYTYGAYSRTYTKRLGGSFEATSEVRTSVTGESLKEFFYELNRIRDDKASSEELNDAKNYLTGVFPIRAETQTGLTGLIVSKLLYDLPDDYLETYRDNINKVTLEDVQRVANKYILPDKIAIVIVGDGDEVLPQAKDYAETIEIFDAENNRQDLSNYESDSSAETADLSGDWTISVEAMGQKMDMKMKVSQKDNLIKGNLSSMMGDGEITEGTVTGNKFSAKATTEFQGMELEITIKGRIDGDEISGSLTAPMAPKPYEFSGKRS